MQLHKGFAILIELTNDKGAVGLVMTVLCSSAHGTRHIYIYI